MDELKLSLEEEIKEQARKIEDEIMHNQDNENPEVSDRMDEALLSKIRSYEKNREEEITHKLASTKNNVEGSLSEEDKEALRLGRELLKKKEAEPDLFEVNREYHMHLKSEQTTYKEKHRIKDFFRKIFRKS